MEKNCTFLLDEMAEEMNNTLKHIEKVMSEQKELVELVKKNDKDDKFKTFIKEASESINKLEDQLNTLQVRYQRLASVLEVCHNNEQTAVIISTLCLALGVINEDALKE